MEKISITKYKAFNGKIFDNAPDCWLYEIEQSKKYMTNLRNFEIRFPMQQDHVNHHAYLIMSENQFNIFKAFMLNKYSDLDGMFVNYEGNGWYVVQSEDDTCWARVVKLSKVIEELKYTMNTIANKTMNFEEV